LEGRTDNKSIDILISLLNNNNHTVRYWTARTIKDNNSPRLQSKEIKRKIAKIFDEAK
jgi:hypothetical protein